MAIFRTFFLFFILLWSFAANGQHYNRYCNSVIPFCLDVPGSFNRVGASAGGEGQTFTAKDGSTLNIFAVFNTDHETLEQRLTREQTALATDTTIDNFTQIPTSGQVEAEKDSFTFTYQHAKFTHFNFRKLESDHWINIEVKYPTAKARDYEDKIKRMLASLK